MEKTKYEAIAIDLRQIADEIYEKNTLVLTVPYMIYLTEEDARFIENHIRLRKYKELINANKH